MSQSRGRQRALKRDQRRLGKRVQPEPRGQLLAQEGEVDFLARGVDHEPQCSFRAERAGDHEVVDDSAAFVEQLGVALTAWRKVEKVRGTQRFEKGSDDGMVSALDQGLTHVRDVKQPRSLAGLEVLGEHASRIVDGHLVARERRHARAKLDVQGVERSL